jgi:sigma-B regulation protein RsbU (phosphoserine phosphatase)
MVGGDYYDFMRLKPQSLLAVIADVEGKGVASALMMANLHASLHTLTTHVHALEHIVESINEMIFSDTRVQKLLSMFVAVIDERNRVLHYINAGHVPPAVISPGGEVVQLDEGGIVLGAVANATYQRGRIQLRPGDIFAAYTDGITEAMDVQGEQYGLQRLVNLVRSERTSPAKQIVETVLSEVDRFSTNSPDEDDRVMLILKVR